MTPRTLTAPPTDRGYWRRLLALTHPDRGGDHDLFIWTRSVYECVAADGIEDVRTTYQRRQPPPHPTAGERVPFDHYADHAALTDRAVHMADAVAEPFAFLLRSLSACYRAEDGPLYHQQRKGATYKQLAAIGHRVGMSKAERGQWYAICKSIPLSQRHAGHILDHLQERAA